jgi:signal transduction histidine kinase
MQLLIAELRPTPLFAGGLAPAIRRHVSQRDLPDSLAFSIQVDGGLPLEPREEEGLFCIAREAINNVVKHASASQARLSLHLEPPPWMEIADDGCGFRDEPALAGVGLAGMRERAAEIGWDLVVDTEPGSGTRIRVMRPSTEGS